MQKKLSFHFGGRNFCKSAGSNAIRLSVSYPNGKGSTYFKDWFAENCPQIDFHSLAFDIYEEIHEKTDFLSLAVLDGSTLLTPIRWAVFRIILSKTEDVFILDSVLAQNVAEIYVERDIDPNYIDILQELCVAYGVSFSVVGKKVPRYKKVISRLVSSSWLSYLMVVWHRFYTDIYAYRRYQKYCTSSKVLPTKLSSTGLPLFVSALSNWQKVFDEEYREETVLQKVLDAAGPNVTELTFVDDHTAAWKMRAALPSSRLLWDQLVGFERESHRLSDKRCEDLLTSFRANIERWRRAIESEVASNVSGVSIASLVKDEIAKLAMSQAARGVMRVRIADGLLGRLAPSYIVMIGELSGAADCIAISAKYHGIPTAGFTHAVTHKYMMNYRYFPGEQLELVPVPDIMCFWGIRERQLFTSTFASRGPEVDLVTGYPRKKVNYSRETKEKIKKINNCIENKPIVLCSSNNRQHHFAQHFMRGFRNIARECNLIVKLHPRELNYYQYQFWANFFKIENVNVVQDVDFLSVLSVADVHVAFSSTTLIEAAMLNIPSVVLDPHGLRQDPLEIVSRGVGVFSSEFASIGDAILYAISKRYDIQFLHACSILREDSLKPEVSVEEVLLRLKNIRGGIANDA